MSSILIKGTKMPKNCYACDIGRLNCKAGVVYCGITGKDTDDVENSKIRPSWCPFDEAPTEKVGGE